MQSTLDMLMSMHYTNLRFIVIIIIITSAAHWLSSAIFIRDVSYLSDRCHAPWATVCTLGPISVWAVSMCGWQKSLNLLLQHMHCHSDHVTCRRRTDGCSRLFITGHSSVLLLISGVQAYWGPEVTQILYLLLVLIN